MKKTLLSILIVLVALFAIDRLGGQLMWWASQNSQDIAGPKIKYLVNDVNEDIVLMGTSRCNVHYVPSIISDSLGMSVFNGGIDAAQNIFSHYIILNHILAHHSPKVIVLDVWEPDLIGANVFNSVSFFAPYFGKNVFSDSVMRDAGKYATYSISHLYRFNAKAPNYILGLIKNQNEKNDHGYYPLPKPQNSPDKLRHVHSTQEINSLKEHYLQRFVDQCRNHGVFVIFSISPRYTVADSSVYAPFRDFADRNSIPLFDYHTKGMFHDCKDCFKDINHLWDSPARVFSSQFAHDIKPLIENFE